MKLHNRDRILQFASISFDASIEEIYPCLIAGGTLVLRSEEMGYSPSLLLQKCHDYGITILDLPTAFWHLLTAELENNRCITITRLNSFSNCWWRSSQPQQSSNLESISKNVLSTNQYLWSLQKRR